MHRQSFSWRAAGALLAIFAGLWVLTAAIWPHVGLSTSVPSATWLISLVVGLGFLAAVFLSDRSTALARVILAVGAVALLVSAVVWGNLFGPDQGWVLIGYSLFPVVLAVIAAFTIGPPERSPSR
jgi:hypothetical protein